MPKRKLLIPLLVLASGCADLTAPPSEGASSIGVRPASAKIYILPGIDANACRSYGYVYDEELGGCYCPFGAPCYDIGPNDPADPDTSSNGGGGGGWTPPPPPLDECDPAVEGCLLDLRPEDIALMDSIQALFKDSFVDSTAASVCSQLQTRFEQLMAQGKVKRGSPDIPDGEYPHAGAYWNNQFHLDQEYLDKASYSNTSEGDYWRRILAQLVLHEAAHELSLGSHDSTVEWNDLTMYPFNYVHGLNGAEGCVSGSGSVALLRSRKDLVTDRLQGAELRWIRLRLRRVRHG